MQSGANLAIDVGAVWCTFFKRPGFFSPLFHRALENAYRNPSFFTSELRDAGARICFAYCDEAIGAQDFDGTTRKLDDELDLLYVATHGESTSNGYKVLFHADDWYPKQTGLAPVVAVFDTCELTKTPEIDAQKWTLPTINKSLRIVLGFDGAATMARGARRGEAFAKLLLEGHPICPAWLRAVHSTTPHVYDKAIAIAIGDDDDDAAKVFEETTIWQLPGSRRQDFATVFWRY